MPHPRHLHPLQFALFCAHLCAPGSRTDVHMVRRRTAWLGGYCGCPIPPGPRAGQPLNPGCWKSHKTPADRWLAGGPVTGPASVKLPTGRWASELGFSVGSVCLRRPSAPGQPRPGSLGLQLAQDAGSLVPTSPNPLIVSGKQGKGQEKQTVHHSGSCVLTGKGDRSGPVVQHPQSPAVRWLWLCLPLRVDSDRRWGHPTDDVQPSRKSETTRLEGGQACHSARPRGWLVPCLRVPMRGLACRVTRCRGS